MQDPINCSNNRYLGTGRLPLGRSLLFALAFGVAVGATVAVAESGTAEHHGSIADLGWFWVNFAIYVTLLTAVLRKPLITGWVARRARIAQEVAAATSEMATAERELLLVETLAKNIVADQAAARSEILAQGELEARDIATAAQEKSLRLKSQVKELLQGESRSAQAQFRTALVAKAVGLSKARFQNGEFASRQSAYLEAAIDRAKRLVR